MKKYMHNYVEFKQTKIIMQLDIVCVITHQFLINLLQTHIFIYRYVQILRYRLFNVYIKVLYICYCNLQGEDYEIIPKTTFTLSRTAHTDDSTSYEMDGKRAKYKDVAKALRQYGIDLEHSRFLILQVSHNFFLHI